MPCPMPRLAALLLAGAGTVLAASPAYALREPTPSRFDPHVGHVPYNADDVVHVPTEVGREVTIVLSPDESIPAGKVAVSDRVNLRALPDANLLFLKATRALDPQPITVRAVLPDGSARVHVFQFEAFEPGGNKPHFYKVQVDYPREAAAARAAAWRKQHKQEGERRLGEQLHAPAPSFALNKRYVGQGAASMLPTGEAWDDGQFTYFRLPNHARVPAFYVVNPDGKEAQVTSFNKAGDVVTVPQTAPAWRLRDGDAVLSLWNLGYDPVGTSTGTGTVSPYVERTVRLGAGAP